MYTKNKSKKREENEKVRKKKDPDYTEAMKY